ncbi:MAG: DUF3168 domain-containing protein [Ketobacter sp.]|nr:DUF3168 domain-containing protein [Ketobacter sp.]
MTIESAIYSHLSTKSSITALVSDRIYPQIAPNSAEYPFITYNIVTEDHDHSMGGATGLANLILQLDVWASTVPTQVSLSEALRNALDGFKGLMGSEDLDIRNCFLQNRASFFEPRTEGKEIPDYRTTLDFSIWHVETVPTL